MSVLHIVAPVALSAMTVFGALTSVQGFPDRVHVNSYVATDSTDSVKTVDSGKGAQLDTFTPPLLGPSLRYGVDTTVSPCVDFYQYVNGDWRAKTTLGKLAAGQKKYVDIWADMYRRAQRRLQVILDSAQSIAATTTDPTLKALGTFYGSCLTADSLERDRLRSARSQTLVPDSTRADQCVQRTLATLGGALGQAFAHDLLGSQAIERMEGLLEALRAAAIEQVTANPWMTPDEKGLALERLQRLKLRVGIPKQTVDYTSLVLTTNYIQNKKAVANFDTQQWVNAIGSDVRAQWKRSLLRLNASYLPGEHAIEVPPILFMPPFFDVTAEDALNFAGIGYIIGHEIVHSITALLWASDNPGMKDNMAQFKALNSALGTVDGWDTDGTRTFQEDIADHGGVLIAYAAWKATLKKSGKPAASTVDGYTPDQRFFIGIARVWRAKWQGYDGKNDNHAAPFARVNAIVLSAPPFAPAFGCKAGDPMVRPIEKNVVIW